MTEPCSGFDLLLMVYADGEASPEERRAVEAHVGECPPCRDRLREWQALNRHADALVQEMSAGTLAAAPGQHRTPADRSPSSVSTNSRPGESQAPAQRVSAPVAPGKERRSERAAHRTLAIGVMMSLLAVFLIPLAVAKQESRQAPSVAPPVTAGIASVLLKQTTVSTETVTTRTTALTTFAVAATSVASVLSSTPLVQPAVADGIGLSGTIAAVRGGDIYLHSSAGDSQITHGGTATAPRWSRSGQWLLYETTGAASGAGLMLTQPGNDAVPWPLPEPAHKGLARWSPHHDEIAVAVRGGSLWLVQAGSDTPRQLLPAGGAVTNIAWSPDGSQLAVERRGVGGAPQSIWLVTRGGAIAEAPIPLAAKQPTVELSRPNDADAADATVPVLGSWSPSNAGFTYWSNSARAAASTPAPLALWSLHQGAHPLLPSVLMYRDFVSWAPDGHALAAVASVLTPDGSERLGQITIVPVAPPGTARELSDAGRADGDAAWSPDGNLIAYASSAVAASPGSIDKGRQIWVEAPDGSGRRPLSPGPEDSFPQWSKDGKEILYVHQVAGGAQLWLVGRDGSDPHPVVSGIIGAQQIPSQNFGDSGLASYRGVFDWSDAAGGG